jgi:hypothetical protein
MQIAVAEGDRHVISPAFFISQDAHSRGVRGHRCLRGWRHAGRTQTALAAVAANQAPRSAVTLAIDPAGTGYAFYRGQDKRRVPADGA